MLKNAIVVNIIPGGGSGKPAMAEVTIIPPTSEQEADNLCRATAAIVVELAQRLPTTQFACHASCSFAAIIEEAHRLYHKVDPDGYRRVVQAGMLTQAVVTGQPN